MKRTKSAREPEREDESLGQAIYPLIMQAIKDTSLWLSIKASAEEKFHIRRAQARLNELARICERDPNFLPPPRTNAEWNQIAAEVLSFVKKAVDVRKSIVGAGLHRLTELLAHPTKGEKQLPAENLNNRVNAFIELVFNETNQKVTRKDISLVMGYKDRTTFQRLQRNDRRTTSSAKSAFERVLSMEPKDFVRRLENIKKRQN